MASLTDAFGWLDAVRFAAQFVEPKWPRDSGMFDSHAVYRLQDLALLLLASAREHGMPYDVPPSVVRELAAEPERAIALVTERVISRGDAALSKLAEDLLREHVPLPNVIEVPTALTDHRGVPFRWGLEWPTWALPAPEAAAEAG
ncbi:MAG: hypothetical protein JO362_24155 [Streptomycetaceae bacterium]|nr:hypothetical protein [Streptomycetaceae bacterium]